MVGFQGETLNLSAILPEAGNNIPTQLNVNVPAPMMIPIPVCFPLPVPFNSASAGGPVTVSPVVNTNSNPIVQLPREKPASSVPVQPDVSSA